VAPRHRVLATGVGFAEGPVITRGGKIVVTSIDHGCLYRITPAGAEVLAVTGGGPNGATEGPDGNLYVAQNGGSRPAHRWPYVTGGVQAVRPGGRVDWLTQDPVAPNDLCFGPDGLLYVTDPTRRIERDDGRLWRCHIATGETEWLVSLPWYPNGIGFGLDDDGVYVAVTGESRIARFPIIPGGRLGRPETYVQLDHGRPDGFAFDVAGNIVIAAVGTGGASGDIQTYDRSGRLLDVYRPGASVKFTNVALGADHVLIITDSDAGAVLAVDDWPTAGLPLHPFRKGDAS